MGDEERNDVVDIQDEESPEVEESPVSSSPSNIIKILMYVVGAVVLIFLIIGIVLLLM